MRNPGVLLVLGALFLAPHLPAQNAAPEREEPPLLLEDEPASPAGVKGADNSRCYVCHLNFAREEIALVHARRNIGCPACHGDCDAHISDESWASGGPGTPPGIMYPRETIDRACSKCHLKHVAPARAILERARARGLAATDPGRIVCTDCHGNHRLKARLRKAWWNKRTGTPIPPPSPRRARPK